MYRFLIFACSTLLTSGCLQTENSSALDGDTYGDINGTPAFLAARTVMSTNCVPCHDYHAQTEEELLAAGDIVAGDAINSKIYYRLNGSSGPNGSKNMPTTGALSAADVTKIYDWIQGIAVP